MTDYKNHRTVTSGASGQINVWKTGAIVFAVGVAVWTLFLFLSPPRITSGDITCFKDPGINLAQGRGLVEIVTPGNPTLVPKFYANYPPLFPALYGIYVSQFGVSAKADQLFDFFLAGGASILFWFFVTPRYTNPRERIPCLILLGFLIIMLPIGPFWTQRERPDALGFIVMMASLSLARGELSPKRIWLAAFVAGLGSLISPFTFAMNITALGCLILLNGGPLFSFRGLRNRRFLQLTIATGLGVIVPFASLFLIQWLNDPESVSRFISNALGKTTHGRAGAGYLSSLLAGDFKTYLGAFSRFDSIRYKWMLAHLIVVAVVATLHLVAANLHSSTPRARWQPLSLLALAAIPLLVFPYQPCYMSLTAAMVLILFALCNGANKQQYKVSNLWVPVIGVGFLALVAAPFLFREFIIAFQARDSYLKATAMIRHLNTDSDRSYHLVASSASSYFLFKQSGFEAVEVAYLQHPEDIVRVDLFAFNAMGRSEGIDHRFPTWWDADKMELVHLAESAPDLKLFGITIYRGGATWEPDLYRSKH